MKRLISYLYQYEGEKRGVGAGFAKVDFRSDGIRLEIHVKYARPLTEMQQVFFITDVGEGILMKLGEMSVNRGLGQSQYMITTEELKERGLGTDNLMGIAIAMGDRSWVISRWKEIPNEEITVAKLWNQVWPATREEAGKQDGQRVESAKEVPDTESEGREEGQGYEEEVGTNPQEKDASFKFEMPCLKECNDNMTGELEKRESEEDHEGHLAEEEMIRDGISWRKVDIKEIKTLPEEYHYLGNNSFLLHNYFSYGYLMLGRKNEEPDYWFLGVPGEDNRQERIMAFVFGFPDFMETDEEGHKGYYVSKLEIREYK